jgi:GxxExxY protein
MNADSIDSLSKSVLGAIFEVSNTPGAGFPEKVYQRTPLRELRLRGIRATAEDAFAAIYKGQPVGEYFADIVVEDELVAELKCAERISGEHTALCLIYLRASGRTVCLPVNFHRPKVEWKRIVRGFPVSDPPEMPAAAR